MPPINRAIFLDRDNTIIHNDGDLGDPAQIRLIRGAANSIGSLHMLGFHIIVISNQGGVARGKYTEADVDRVNQRISTLVHENGGGIIDRFYYCPFHPDGTIEEYKREHPWRKPQPGMLLQAAKDLNLNLNDCWMIGDQERDVQAGNQAGCTTILLTTKTTSNSSAHYQVETLAEAATIIAQNKTRYRNIHLSEISNPAKIPDKPVPAINTPKTIETQADNLTSATSTKTKTKTKTKTPVQEINTPQNKIEHKDNNELERDDDKVTSLLFDDTPEANTENYFKAINHNQDTNNDPPLITITSRKTTEKITATKPPTQATQVRQSENQPDTTPVKTITRQAEEYSSINSQDKNNDIQQPAYKQPNQNAINEQTRLLSELVTEVRSWRFTSHEFTPGKMLAAIVMLAILAFAVALAIYIDPDKAIVWIGIACSAQLTVLAMLIISGLRS